MLLILTILTATAIIVVVKIYSNSNGRIPSLSTRRGKEARIVCGFLLVCFLFLLALNASRNAADKGDIVKWILLFMLGGTVPIWRYIEDRKNRHK